MALKRTTMRSLTRDIRLHVTQARMLLAGDRPPSQAEYDDLVAVVTKHLDGIDGTLTVIDGFPSYTRIEPEET